MQEVNGQCDYSTKKPCWSGKAAKHLVWYFKGELILLNSVCKHSEHFNVTNMEHSQFTFSCTKGQR